MRHVSRYYYCWRRARLWQTIVRKDPVETLETLRKAGQPDEYPNIWLSRHARIVARFAGEVGHLAIFREPENQLFHSICQMADPPLQ